MRRITRLYSIALTPLALAVATSLQAAEEDTAVEETIVVASRAETAANLTGVSVTVLDRESIDALAYPDMADLLDAQVGVTVTQNGGFGGVSNVRIRGEEGFRTRVIVDGIDLADPSSPQISPRFEHLLTQGVERVEILRGPQGLLWGADAGGVISITSQMPSDGLSGAVSAEVGARGFEQWSANAAAGNDTVGIAGAVSRLSSDGINARSDDTVTADEDGYENTSVRLSGRAALGAGFALNASLIDIEGDNEFDGCFDSVTFGNSNNCDDSYEQRAWRVGLSNTGERHSVETALSDATTDRVFFTNGIQGFTAEGTTEQVSLIGSWRATDSLRVSYGIENAEQAFDDGFSSRQRDNLGVYGELMRSWGSGSISASVRHDDNDDFGTFNSWRLAAITELSAGGQVFTLRAAAGTGFRAPSLFEVAYNTGLSAFPPASLTTLDAEESDGWELAVATTLGNTRIEVIGFNQSIDNAIFFDLAGFSGYLQAPGTIESRGIETVIAARLTDNLSIDANATWNDTENEAGEQRAYRPEWSSRVSLLWSGSRWTGTLTARSSAETVDPFGQDFDNSLIVDAVARWPVTDSLMLSARAENLSDEDAQQVVPFNMPGRAFYVGASYSL